MKPTVHIRRVLSGSLCACILALWWTLTAAQTRVYIDIDQAGGYLLPVAIPKVLGAPDHPKLAEEVRAVLQSDLESTGLFRIVDPATHIDEFPAGLDVLRYQNWAAVGALGVIVGRVHQPPGDPQMTIELVLHDVVQQRTRFAGKEYRAPLDRAREVMHRFADLVFEAFTGEKGPFNTQVLCSAPRRAGQRARDILLMDYDGHGVRKLVDDGAFNLAPMVSPDGHVLAYTSYRGDVPNIYLYHLRTGEERQLTSGPGLKLPGSWSPNGRYLAFSQTQDDNTDIFLYDTKRQRTTRVTRYWGIDVSPSFAPDSTRLVFTSDRSGSPQLYLTDVGGRPPIRLTYDGKYNTSPAWAPHENVIAFVGRSEEGTLDIYTMRADGGQLRRLTDGKGKRESPTWAPDGRFVMYNSLSEDTWQRYVIRSDGQGQRQLTAVQPVCLSPQWIARAVR